MGTPFFLLLGVASCPATVFGKPAERGEEREREGSRQHSVMQLSPTFAADAADAGTEGLCVLAAGFPSLPHSTLSLLLFFFPKIVEGGGYPY